jgi:hypothetical protein
VVASDDGAFGMDGGAALAGEGAAGDFLVRVAMAEVAPRHGAAEGEPSGEVALDGGACFVDCDEVVVAPPADPEDSASGGAAAGDADGFKRRWRAWTRSSSRVAR